MNEHNDCSEQIKKLNPSQGDLLVVTTPGYLSQDQRKTAQETLRPLAERLGCALLVLEGGATAEIKPSGNALLAEMQKQTAILEGMAEQQAILLQELAGDDSDDDQQPLAYMDGTPIRGAD